MSQAPGPQPRCGHCSPQGPGPGCPVGCSTSHEAHAMRTADPWHPDSWALVNLDEGNASMVRSALHKDASVLFR